MEKDELQTLIKLMKAQQIRSQIQQMDQIKILTEIKEELCRVNGLLDQHLKNVDKIRSDHMKEVTVYDPDPKEEADIFRDKKEVQHGRTREGESEKPDQDPGSRS